MTETQKRYYTHSVVSYASLEELTDLISSAKHYAYIKHDRDTADTHYHLLITFDREKSFEWVRKKVVSNQNTFSQAVISDIASVLEYFTHEEQTEKALYSIDDIVFDDKRYWTKRVKSLEAEEDKNDVFVDDLLSDDFSIEKMSRKYGRDFIKNFKAYEEARRRMLFDRELAVKQTKQKEYEEEMAKKLELYYELMKEF